MRDKLIGALIGVTISVMTAGLAVWRNDAVQTERIKALAVEVKAARAAAEKSSESAEKVREITARLEVAIGILDERTRQDAVRDYLPVLRERKATP